MSGQAGHFDEPATPESLELLVIKLKERNIEATVVADESSAYEAVLQRLPEGAEVHAGKSKTLQDIGVTPVLVEGGRYTYLRNTT
jgi:hypothetical protein